MLSKNHPEVDICDKLSAPNQREYDADDKRGLYPKDFVFDGWHPQCFCFVIPVMVAPEEMAKMNEAFVKGEDYTPKGEQVTECPKEFKDWCRDNATKIKEAQQRGTEPYFIRNNAEAVENILKKEKSNADNTTISDQDNSYISTLPYKNGKEFFDSLCEIKDHQEERLERAQGVAEYAKGIIYLAGDKQDYIDSFNNIVSGNYTDKDIKRMQMVIHERQHWLSEVKGVKIGDNLADYNYDKTIFEVVNELLARQEMQRIFPDRLLFLDEDNGGYIRKCYELQRLCKRLNVDYDAFANALPTLQSHRSTDLAKLFAQFAEKPETAEWYNELISNFYASGDDFDFGLKGRDYCEKMLVKAKYIKRGENLLPKPDAWYYEFSKWGDKYEPYRLHGAAKGASPKGSNLLECVCDDNSLLLKPTPVKDISHIETRIMDILKSNPDIYGDKIKGIIAISQETAFANTSDGVIRINFAESAEGFNQGESLLSAFGKIKRGKPLTEHEEYSIEVLWHEILHNKSRNTAILPIIDSPQGFARAAMETVNQLVARHTYGDFLKQLGGKAEHTEWILGNGYGYHSTVANLRKLLSAANIDEKSFIKAIESDLMNDYTDFDKKVGKVLRKLYKGKKDIAYVFQSIEFEDFDERLKIILD